MKLFGRSSFIVMGLPNWTGHFFSVVMAWGKLLDALVTILSFGFLHGKFSRLTQRLAIFLIHKLKGVKY